VKDAVAGGAVMLAVSGAAAPANSESGFSDDTSIATVSSRHVALADSVPASSRAGQLTLPAMPVAMSVIWPPSWSTTRPPLISTAPKGSDGYSPGSSGFSANAWRASAMAAAMRPPLGSSGM
jgi:hypothetical protein